MLNFILGFILGLICGQATLILILLFVNQSDYDDKYMEQLLEEAEELHSLRGDKSNDKNLRNLPALE